MRVLDSACSSDRFRQKISVMDTQNGFFTDPRRCPREFLSPNPFSNRSSRVLPKITDSVQYEPHFRRG